MLPLLQMALHSSWFADSAGREGDGVGVGGSGSAEAETE